MKIGSKGAVFYLCLGVGFYLGLKHYAQRMINDELNDEFAEKYQEDNFKPNNALIEFFESDKIIEAYSRYEEYLDLGLNKQDAFKAVVEDKRNT